MPTISVTINTPASGPFNLAQLFAGNNYSGAVTILPATPIKPPSKPDTLLIQADPGNGANYALVGDKNLTPTTTCQGVRLAAGGSIAKINRAQSLSQRYINGSAATVVINIDTEGGMQ